MKMERKMGGVIAWHGTDRTDFDSFDVSCAAPYDVGLHFGTRAAALDSIAALDRIANLGRAVAPRPPLTPSAPTRLLECCLNIRLGRGNCSCRISHRNAA